MPNRRADQQSWPRILVVDDDWVILQGLRKTLEKMRCKTLGAQSSEEARELFLQEPCDLVLLDIRLPDEDGLSLLRWILEQDEDQLVIMMTAFADPTTAVEAMKAGAHDYIHKPFDLEEVRILVSKALELRRMRGELYELKQHHGGEIPPHEIIGISPAIRRIRSLVRKVSRTPRTSVLIQGESGTGKERVAQAIHFQSDRRDAFLLKLNCSTIPPQLMESELFGYERGAFTDAKRPKKGLLEMAHRGSLFLDEIGDLDLSLQPKLLRFLETKSFQRVGGLREIHVDVRVIAATHRDLRQMVEEGRFRQDLYYRLKVMVIHIPPLRERKEDILLLAHYFLDEISRELGKRSLSLTEEARGRLLTYPWPGNARELRNVLERAAILSSSGIIRPDHLKLDEPLSIHPVARRAFTPERPPAPGDDLSLERVQKEHILRVLELVGGNKSEAARRLGISRSTLQERLKAYSRSDSSLRATR